jgi:adenylate cyclase
MAKILVVDDETDLELLIKQKFRRQIREEVYEFVFAINGRHALETLEQHTDIDVVLTDINMPEMDGLTLLGKMHEMNLLIKSVVVSAYGDMENIRTAMNRGAFDFVTKPVNFDDLGLTIEKTIRHVNQMKQTLKAIKENDILKMYVDESVLNFMHSREYETSLTASETLEASVVFIDICGFTSISEKETPETVVGLLNSYFDLITREILAQNGFIDKFIGDCVMAVFKGEHHLDRALDACLAVRDQVDSLPEAGSSHFVPKVSIGVNSGEMVSGNIGSANLRRLDYTVIGDAVNTAQRLQSVAAPSQIVINQASYEKVKQSFNCREIGMVNVKNKAGEIKIYEVVE